MLNKIIRNNYIKGAFNSKIDVLDSIEKITGIKPQFERLKCVMS